MEFGVHDSGGEDSNPIIMTYSESKSMLDRFMAKGNIQKRLDDAWKRLRFKGWSLERLVKAARAAEVAVAMEKNKLNQLELELEKRGQPFQRRPALNGGSPQPKRPRGRPPKSSMFTKTRSQKFQENHP